MINYELLQTALEIFCGLTLLGIFICLVTD
jgi:hypothetical protein